MLRVVAQYHLVVQLQEECDSLVVLNFIDCMHAYIDTQEQHKVTSITTLPLLMAPH